MPNANLAAAKAAKNDEFYTRYRDIGRELSRYYEHDRDFLRCEVVNVQNRMNESMRR